MQRPLFGRHTRRATAYGLALALALVALLAGNGEAKWTGMNAAGCTLHPLQPGTPDADQGVLNFSSTHHADVLCVVADTGAAVQRNLTAFYVHGYNGNSSDPARVEVCATRRYTPGGSCGRTAYAAGVGYYTLPPDRSAWASAARSDVGYLYVRLPPFGDGHASSFRRYYTEEHGDGKPQGTLQRREQRLYRPMGTFNTPHGTVAEVHAHQPGDLTPEAGRAAELVWWEETRSRFEREAVDTPWAETTTPLFVADLTTLGKASGFAPVQTACRSTQCAAVLEWRSYGQAVQGYAPLLHHPYQANCARHTLLTPPGPAEAAQPYPMTMIFDCSGWRQQD